MKTYNQFSEYLIEQVQWQRSLFDHLFYDGDKLLADDQYGDPSYDEDDENDVNSKGFVSERRQYVFQQPSDRSFHLPLNSRFIERIFGEIQILACHSTGMEGLVKLTKLQKKRTKQISAYTVDNYGSMTSGVWSDNSGGIIAIVKGQAVAGNDNDIWSRVDKQGKRVLDITNNIVNPNEVFGKYGDQTFLKLVKAYEKLTKALLTMKREMISKLKEKYGDKRVPPTNKGEQKWETLRSYDIPGSVKQKAIRDYVIETEKIITSNDEWKQAFVEYLLSWPKAQAKKLKTKSKLGDYDEIVVSNFEIVYAFVAKTVLKRMDNPEYKTPYNNSEEYLKQFKFPIKVLPYGDLDTKRSVLKDYLKEIQTKETKR